MKRIALCVAVLLCAGCGESPSNPKIYDKPVPAMHWVATKSYGGSEDRYLVRNDTEKVVIDIIHSDGPQDIWNVCLGNGSCDGNYLTESEARKRGEQIAKENPSLW